MSERVCQFGTEASEYVGATEEATVGREGKVAHQTTLSGIRIPSGGLLHGPKDLGQGVQGSSLMLIEGALGYVSLFGESRRPLAVPEAMLEESSTVDIPVSQRPQSLLQGPTQGGAPSQGCIGPSIALASALHASQLSQGVSAQRLRPVEAFQGCVNRLDKPSI
jgi:hypothetical protein